MNVLGKYTPIDSNKIELCERALGVKPHGCAYANGLRDKSAENRDKQENWYSSN